MTDQVDPAAVPEEGLDWEESDLPVDAVRSLFVTLGKAFRAFQLYDENNPVRKRFVDTLKGEFEGLWGEVEKLAVSMDEDRIYLTGLSMGGFGTWDWAAAEPRRFAALVPICGFGDPRFAGRLKNVPVWVFHGAKDTAVPLAGSEEIVKALEKMGAKPKFTVYPEAGHDSWTETYNNPELYKWLLEQKRPAKDAGK